VLGSLTMPIYGLCASLALGWIGYCFSRFTKKQTMVWRLLLPFCISGLVGIVCVQGSGVLSDMCTKTKQTLLESDDFLVYIDPTKPSQLFTDATSAIDQVCPNTTGLGELIKPGLAQVPYAAATTAVCTDAENSLLVFGIFLVLAATTPGLADLAAQGLWSSTQNPALSDSEVVVKLLSGTSKF